MAKKKDAPTKRAYTKDGRTVMATERVYEINLKDKGWKPKAAPKPKAEPAAKKTAAKKPAAKKPAAKKTAAKTDGGE